MTGAKFEYWQLTPKEKAKVLRLAVNDRDRKQMLWLTSKWRLKDPARALGIGKHLATFRKDRKAEWKAAGRRGPWDAEAELDKHVEPVWGIKHRALRNEITKALKRAPGLRAEMQAWEKWQRGEPISDRYQRQFEQDAKFEALHEEEIDRHNSGQKSKR